MELLQRKDCQLVYVLIGVIKTVIANLLYKEKEIGITHKTSSNNNITASKTSLHNQQRFFEWLL